MFEIFKKSEFKNIIFIDLENVHSKGFDGIDTLTNDDKVYLYYSKNAKNISIEVFEKYKQGNVSIETISCTAGKNAMDCVLSTHLGALINQFGNSIKYFIVSKDKDYQSVIDFWNEVEIKCIKSVILVHNPDMVIEEQIAPKKQSKKQVPKQTKKQPTAKKQQPKKKHKINVRSRVGMLIKGLNKSDMNRVESIMKSGNKSNYNSMLKDKFGDTKGNDYYSKLKPLIDEINK